MNYTKEQDILLGKRLQDIREGLGYSRDEFAEMFSLSVDQYKRLERGESRITIDKVRLLYQTHHVDPTYLIIGERPAKMDIDYFLANSQKEQRDEFMERIIDYLKRLVIK